MVARDNRKAGKAVQERPCLERKEKDRRSGLDRRWFNYDVHIPERRSQVERRSGKDRKCRDVHNIIRL